MHLFYAGDTLCIPRLSGACPTANSTFATEKIELSVEQAKLETCHEVYLPFYDQLLSVYSCYDQLIRDLF